MVLHRAQCAGGRLSRDAPMRRPPSRGQGACIGALEHPHAGVGAQAVSELSITHVHREHLCGPVLEQAVGEPPRRGPTSSARRQRPRGPCGAGRSPAVPPRDTYRGRSSRTLMSASAGIPRLLLCAPAPDPTRTSPAITEAAARLREENRPRSARRMSRRCLTPTERWHPLTAPIPRPPPPASPRPAEQRRDPRTAERLK